MFQNVSYNGFVSILHSSVKKPLALWDKKIRCGYVKRITDAEIRGMALELIGRKIHNTYITCPGNPLKTLGVKFPVFVILVKLVNKVFAFDVQILDDNNVRRRFRASTQNVHTDVRPFSCKLPLMLEEGWNRVVVPLQDFTKKVYGTNYKETLRVQIYPNCRIQRVYFTNKLLDEENDIRPLSTDTSKNRKTLLSA